MKKRILPCFLALAMALSLLPMSVLAAGDGDDSRVVNGSYSGSGWSEGGNGSITDEATGITLSKTAVPDSSNPSNPNKYTITLKVETSTETTVTDPSAAAVVLVMDLSNSMKACAECGGTETSGNTTYYIHTGDCSHYGEKVTDQQTRLYAAKQAAKDFLKTYAGDSATANRQLAIVAFGTTSKTVFPWANVAGGAGENSYNAAIRTIDNLEPGFENGWYLPYRDSGGTNLEAGIQLAANLVGMSSVSAIASKNVITLTDGVPTYRMGSSADRNATDALCKGGYGVDGGGSSGSSSNNQNAKNAADNVKNKSATLYTVCYGVADETCYTGGPTVGAFLRGSIASPKCAYNANNTDELNKAFEAISESITSGIDGKGLTVTDPMGDYITLDEVPDGAAASESGNGFTWTLGEPTSKREDAGITYYTYELTYNITVNADAKGFDEDAYHPANKPTYITIPGEDGAEPTRIDFPVPGVKGTTSRHNVNYKFVSEDGSKLPEGVMKQLPAAHSERNGETVTPNTTFDPIHATNSGVNGTWGFSVWEPTSQTINGQNVSFEGTWIFTPDTHTITINYVDNDNVPLQLPLTKTQTDNSAYSFDVSSNDTGDIPFIIDKEGTQYVFNCFTTGGNKLNGTLKENLVITAQYLPDANGNKIPDAYEATVTYKVVNGTWSEGDAADKTADFILREFKGETNSWDELHPKLDNTIPTGMKPVSGYAEIGSWNTEISENTPVTGDVTYTYSFGTKLHSITINYEDGDSNHLKDVYTATQNDGSSYSFAVSRDDDAIIPFVITTEDGTHYVYDSLKDGSADLSGTLTGNIDITAVYLVDENKNNVPDVYEATVTYKVVNGTWQDGSVVPIERVFPFKMFDEGEFIWIGGDSPTLNGTIPTGMTPNAGFAEDGAWAPAITKDTPVTKDATYTYTFEKEEAPTPDLDWDVSRSKTATNLDKNYESQVTLSLPSAEETLTSDVVFVLDKSSCEEDVTEQALDMLEELYDAASENNATIKVGAVQFAGEAVVSCVLTDLTEDAVAENGAIYNGLRNQQISSGTNLQAGLLKAQEMLAADTSVQANRKYVVVITDGLTRQFLTEDGTVMAIYNAIDADGTKIWANTSSWCVANDFPDDTFNIPASDWGTYFNTVTENVDKDGDTYAHPMDWSPLDGGYVPLGGDSSNYALCLDRAIYEANVVYRELEDAGYNCYTVFSNATPNNQLGKAFVDYLNDGKTVDFAAIQDEISYLVDDGSYVVDEIGSGTDNKGNAYNFDFVNQAGKLTLKVGEETYSAVSIPAQDGVTASYGFNPVDGQHSYVLNYYQNGTKDVASEHFVWEINVPVSNFAHVQLTYSVKLTNPQSRAGTYGQYDADGSEEYTSLYTNTSAVLTPVDSNDEKGPEQIFAKPTVSYTIKKHDGGGTVEPPVLDTENHYGYIVGYDDGTVRPNGKITRAEVATIFFRLLTDESRDAYWCQTNDFSDVSASDWFNNAISTLTNAGILDGYEDGTFRPNGNITRAEFATIAVRFFDLTYEGEDLFPDISDHWARDYINQAAAAGFVNGYEDGTFRPNNAITRAEAVTLVNRTLERKPHKAHLLADMIQWPDNMDQTTWYYADIQEATNSHEYYMTTSEQGEEYEIWTELLPMRDWPALEKEWSDANSSTGADVTR